MKIDGSIPFPSSPVSAVSGARASSNLFQLIGPQADSNEAKLSSVRSSGEMLSRLQQVPDVRQQRIDALREAVSTGSYQVTDRQIVDALYAQLLAPSVPSAKH